MKFPDQFKENISKIIGAEQISAFIDAMAENAVISIRKNKLKQSPLLLEQGESIPWEPNGIYLKHHPGFITDPAWHTGAYYVQEPSSMLLRHFVKSLPEAGEALCALDLCAAPGGKSTHLLDILSEDSFLVSNEVDPQRFSILKENMQRWGRHNMLLTRASPKEYTRLGENFDLMLVDAPCSGEGMFRKDPQAIHHWGINNIRVCHDRQKDILRDILPCLLPGGVLIYSTCTFNTEENEDIGQWLVESCNMECITPDTPTEWGFTCRKNNNTKVQIAYPHLVRGEGIAMQMFRKPGKRNFNTPKNRAGEKISKELIPSWLALLTENATYTLKKQSDNLIKVIGASVTLESSVNKLLKANQVHWPIAGEWKGKDFIPGHTIAMWPGLLSSEILMHELTIQDSLRYLKGETSLHITHTEQRPQWQIVTYKGNALGWIKVIDKQIKNHYPKSYRIRQSIQHLT